ncbi:NADPH-dependent F420 reductase [Nocardia sp. CA-119907]|uniref:NADPH-dependent F420 reductase n=1 Tax=Nocardia sp. CA-119907 TaxID=3239973 RepID=UPI003D97D5D7
MAGKTVIDTANYYPERDGHLPELDTGALTSSALLQRHLADAHVVKAFNNVTPHQLRSLARSADAPDRSGLPIAADDAEARAEAIRLLDVLGYDAVDIGTLAASWRSEPDTRCTSSPTSATSQLWTSKHSCAGPAEPPASPSPRRESPNSSKAQSAGLRAKPGCRAPTDSVARTCTWYRDVINSSSTYLPVAAGSRMTPADAASVGGRSRETFS